MKYAIIGITPANLAIKLADAENLIQAEQIARKLQLTLTVFKAIEIITN